MHGGFVQSGFLVVVLAACVSSQTPSLVCDTGYDLLSGDKCVKVYGTSDLSWYSAKDVCTRYGSRLVTIKDQYDNDKLGELVRLRTGRYDTSYWIGLSQSFEDTCSCNELRWETGNIATENEGFWIDDQPDDRRGDCVYSQNNTQSGFNYVYDRPFAWSYDNCNVKHAFVCEKAAAPAGSFLCLSGGYVREGDQCNGIADCLDGSDELSCPARCRYRYEGERGPLNSLLNYGNGQTCTWAITVPLGYNAYVELQNFQTEKDADFVTIFTGSIIETKATRIARISGNIAGVQRFQSSDNVIYIKFSSDSVGTGSGFTGQYGSARPTQGARETLIAYPTTRVYNIEQQLGNTSSFVGMNDYVMVIETVNQEIGKIITLQINEMAIHDDDYIEVYDGENPYSPVLAKLCNSGCNNYDVVFSTGTKMSILFRRMKSMDMDVRFAFSYTQGCSYSTTNKWGMFFTPGYPARINYPNFVECSWKIQPGEPITVYFNPDLQLRDQDFGIVNNGDFVEMFEGGNRVSPATRGFNTSELAGNTFKVESGMLEVTFKSSPIRSARGFKATWSTGCVNPNYDEFTIRNPQNDDFYYYKAVSTLTCATGYAFQQEQISSGTTSVIIECGYKGEWLTYKQIPRCTPVYCGDVPPIQNGYIQSSTGSVFNSVANYQCFPGLTIQGSQTITCNSNAQWDVSPTCQAATCQPLGTGIDNGQGTITNGDGFTIGSIVEYTCNPGFEIVGDPIKFCQNDGTYSSRTVSCKRTTCKLPPIMRESYILINAGDFVDYETVVQVQCNTGYRLETSTLQSVTCLANRTVTQLPVCTDVDECLTQCQNNADCTNTVGSFSCTCRDGYTGDGLSCSNVDECSLDNPPCDQSCQDTIGSYICNCSQPYVLFSNNMVSGYEVPPSETGYLPTDTLRYNHSCVLIECPAPPDNIANAMLLDKRDHHRFGDHVEYQCNVGFIPRSTFLVCQQDGTWSGTPPQCVAATCQTESTGVLQNPAVFNSGPYNYGQQVYLNCTRAGQMFSNFRHCTYNPQSDTYELQGSSYECGEINCGQIESQFSNTVGDTIYPAQFSAFCPGGTTISGVGPDQTTSTVTCSADGRWEYGSLQCLGQSCVDPGYPAGGDIEATSFASGSVVSFKCLRQGYTLSSITSLTCQGSVWSATTPVVDGCIDTEQPTFSGACETTITLNKYEHLAPRLPLITVSDNTGIEEFTISPANANSTLYPDQPLTVTYAAFDYRRNSATCVINVLIADETPPSITCPPLQSIYLDTMSSEVNLTLQRNQFTTSDNIDVQSFNYINALPKSTFTVADLYNTFTYQAEVRDSSNNADTCRGQVFVEPRPVACVELGFPTPLNAVKECTGTTTSMSCTITCDNQYTFEMIRGRTTTVTCTNGVWNEMPIPACVLDVTKPAITCPSSSNVMLTLQTDEEFVDFTSLITQDVDFTEFDLNTIKSHSFSIDNKTFTAADLYQTTEITLVVTDMADNSASCKFQYTVMPRPCSPLSLPTPVNAKANVCNRRNLVQNVGYDCTVECNDGFVLRGIGTQQTVSCNDGQLWTEIYPSCVQDGTRPVVQCPESRIITLASSLQTVNITFGDIDSPVQFIGTATDIGGIDRIVYNPPTKLIDRSFVHQSPISHQMIAFDKRGLSTSCFFYILVDAATCSDLSLPTPVNGRKNCSQNANSGWTCIFTCNPGFTFTSTTNTQISSTCNPGSPFDTYVPACVSGSLSTPKQFIGTLRYEYVPTSTGVTNVPSQCVQHYIDQNTQSSTVGIATTVSQMAGKMRELCNAVDSYLVTVEFLSFNGSTAISGSTPVITIDYTYTLKDANITAYTRCAQVFQNLLENSLGLGDGYQLGQNIQGDQTGVCPAVEWRGTALQIRSDLYCIKPYYQSLQDSTKCVLCPAGTQSDGLVCTPCPIGTYRQGTSFGQCQPCPNSGTTWYPGATSNSQCTTPCSSPGRISSNGFEPCYSCDLGFYAVNNTSCQRCPTGTTTTFPGASSVDSCQAITVVISEPCGPGVQSDGTTGCTLCDFGTYKTGNVGTCVNCQALSTTYIQGAVSSAACKGLCGAGLFSTSGKSPCRACPKGTYSFNSTYCQSCPSGSTTEGVGATSQSFCVAETSLRVNCPRGTYRSSTTGNCLNCGFGTFQDSENQFDCKSCGPGKSTYVMGATSSSQCFDTCTPGFRSDTGRSPCQPCGVGFYWRNSSSCEACPDGGITVSNAATSVAECRARCPAGQFSSSGFDLVNSRCRACPRNHYQENTGSTSCNRCSDNTYTTANGQTSAAQCVTPTPLCNCGSGVTCSYNQNRAICQCLPGKFGSSCEGTVNYCNSNPCYNGGICSSNSSGHTCDCRGLATGPNCENIVKTCDGSFCSDNSYCINRPGFVECLCKDGFSGERCLTNTTICNTNPCDPIGTMLNGCEDVSFGKNIRRKCTCRSGYEGDDCGTNTNDCASTPCINGGACRDLVNGFECDCVNGYTGIYCQNRPNRCQNINCGINSMCVDNHKEETHHCVCSPGYAYGTYTHYSVMLNEAPQAVTGPNLCLTDPVADIQTCRDQCTNTLSCAHFAYQPSTRKCCLLQANQAVNFTTFSSSPFNTYTKMTMRPDDDFYTMKYDLNQPGTSNSNNRDVESRSTMNSQYGLGICAGTTPLAAECCIVGGRCDNLPGGVTCDIDGVRCNNFDCQSINFEIRFKCAAQKVFLSNICTQKNDFCASSPCVRGFCIEQFNGYRCSCPAGYTGLNCQTDINECATDPCQNDGVCVDGVNGYNCVCKEGFQGLNCQSRVNYCLGVTCNNRGPCQTLDTDYSCLCNPGYEGKDCEVQIDRCMSNPCLHGGNCSALFNDYTCSCPPGWFGKNCDQIVDNCASNQGRQCQATCKNIFNNYYCECPNNIFGMNCENQTNPCQDYNKCQNNAGCSVVGDVMSCQCPIQYKGDGCHTLVNHCGITNNCQNGGTCMTTDQGYSCTCPTGYNGLNCENNINECTASSCPGGTCFDTVGKFYCRCPLTKTGLSCGRDYDANYDLYFSHPMAYAWIPYFIQVDDASVVSLSLWVRYSMVNAEGLYMVQYLGDNLATSVKLLELDERGVSIYGPSANTRINEQLTFLRNIKINDGNWHHVAVVYNTTAGTMKLYADTIFHSSISNSALILPDNSFKMWLILGCAFSKADQMCKGTDSFHGYLSQINWYKTVIDFPELTRIYNSPRKWDVLSSTNQLSQMILVWNEYVLESGVDRVIPSQASGVACDNPQRTIPCNFFTVAASMPRVTGCPADVVQLATDRLTQVTWVEPTFMGLGASGVQYPPTYQSGNSFTWNVYDVLYVARSETNHSVYCSFRVYVQESQCKLTPNSPFGGRQPQLVSNNPDGRTGARISCYDGFIIDRKSPDLFTCDATGTWNYAKRFQPFRFPSCGEVKDTSPKVRVVMRMTYLFGTSACTAVRDNLLTLLRDQITILNAVSTRQLCTQTDCSDVQITINCDVQASGRKRRKRQTSSRNEVTIGFSSADSMTSFNGENLSISEFLTYQAIGANVFDFPNIIPNGEILEDQFTLDFNVVCGPNQVVLENQCVECGAGNYFRYTDATNTTAICDDCPIGSYQNVAGQSGCTQCPVGKTTEIAGNFEASSCKDSCQIGYFYDMTTDACQPCPIGFYQDEVGQFRCKGCEAGFTTEFEGTNSSSRCTGTCDHGQQLDGFGQCELCPIGLYRNASESRLCVPCDGGFITAELGARSKDACVVTACEPGNRLNTNNVCEPCPIGFYQDQKWQSSCKPCGALTEYLTLTTGSSSRDQCIFYCQPGLEVSGNFTCSPCAVGTYKEGQLGTCQQCSGNYRTPGTASTSPSDCSIYKCPIGFAPNATNTGCSPCPLGQYQDVEFSTECKSCPVGQSTRDTGANSSSSCEVYCPSGQEKIESSCVVCSQGQYKSNLDGLFSMCQPCPTDFTTVSSGAISSSNCTVRACPAGTRRAPDESSCMSCPMATYQPLPLQMACLSCPNGLSTRQVNSTSLSQCEKFCQDGFQKNAQGNCDPCSIGYYKSNNDGVFSSCQLCPEVNITVGVGSTSISDCNIGNCSAGQRRRSDKICELCPIGTFQENRWQDFCLPCGTDKTTQFEGSTSQDDCILVCKPGFEDVNGACQLCPRGFYKEENEASKCNPCPNDTTTETVGANSSSLCTLPSCLAGTFLDRSSNTPVCRPCGYDTYQDDKWMESCKQCPNGGVTLNTGAAMQSDCVLDCPSGQEYNFAQRSCDFCQIGYYRNKTDRTQPSCQLCDLRFITSTLGSISSSNCTVANCTTPGTYRDADTNTCRDCPIGTYSNVKWRTFCEPCQQGYSTRSTGSSSINDCRPTCPLGQIVGPNNVCVNCPIGTYRQSTASEVCTPCPNGFKTPLPGSDSSADCTISNCTAGRYFDLTSASCLLCPRGTYQPLAGSFQCIGCENGFGYTAQEGSTARTDCNSPCAVGTQYNNVTMLCDFCPRGFYQDVANEFVCKECPSGLKYTATVGSTLRSQCLSFCDNAVSQCSMNATCTTTASGAICNCFINYDDIGTTQGTECVHKCDRGYCQNDAVCVKLPSPRCQCREYYEGDRCETRVRADSLSDNTKDIVVPVAIGVSGLILFLIILAVCCLCYMNQRKAKKAKRPTQYSSFNGDRIDKTSLHSFDYGQTPYNGGMTPRLMLAPHSEFAPYQEVVYDNGAYIKSGDYGMDGSLDSAVYQA